MPQGYYRQIIDLLRDYGCWFVRHGKGDHEIWKSPINDRTFPVDREILSRHTANGILKQAGISAKV